MKNLTPAQEFLLQICEGGDSFKDYKAPHAMRGTPPRPRRRKSMNLPLCPAYKGHRP